MIIKKLFVSGAFLVFVFQIISCTPTKKVIYLNDLSDTTGKGSINSAQTNFENPIQKNDQLAITVGGSNPADLSALSSAKGEGTEETIGYLVEADGTIKLPFIGKVKAEGLSRLQLEDTLSQLFKDYTKNSVVNVRFLNYQFSVMGEVNNKGRFTMTNERTTILEAISIAGDLTELGKRENILIVREEKGVRNFARVNLLSKELFNSPYFYLKTNDVVYVEPVRSKFISRTGIPQLLGIASIVVTLLLAIISVSQ